MKHQDKNNILVLTYWSLNDALIQTYTLPYVKIIAENIPDNNEIFLVTLDKSNEKNNFTENKIQNISIQYFPFGLRGFIMWVKILFKLTLLIKQKKIKTIHAWCTPAGMIGYILSLLTGCDLIIDSYEPHAEAMVENGTWKKNSFAFKLLFKFEKLQTKKAKYLIATTTGMIDYAKQKYFHFNNNFFVKPACVNLELFSKHNIKNKALLKKYNLENKLICVYAGKFGGIYLDKEVFDFFKVAEDYWNNKFVALILSSHTESEIEHLRIQSNLKKESILHMFVKHSEVPDYMGLADFAITPVKSVPTKRYCTPIKNGEYWALGLPVVSTKNISDDSQLIKEQHIGSIIENLDADSYRKSIIEIDNLLKSTTKEELFYKIRSIAIEYRSFSIASDIYKKIYSYT